MKTHLTSALFTLIAFSLGAAQIEEQTPNPDQIRILQIDPTPEPDTVSLVIQFPKENEVKKGKPINIQMRLEGYPLGVDSDFPRSKEIFNDSKGQSVHVFIDNHPYFSVNEAIIDALDDNENYYDQTMDVDIPFPLNPGMHVIRAFPVRSYNESLKGDGCLAARIFYVQNKKEDPSMDIDKPYLIYNEPQGSYDYNPHTPIMLDFYIANCQLSRDGYKVRLTIDETAQRILSDWTPYNIYGLQKGVHTVKLELLDPQNVSVPGAFNKIQRTIFVE
ncbi:MAG: hypothetical protein ACM3JI_00635 [Anaerolineae bacterium]